MVLCVSDGFLKGGSLAFELQIASAKSKCDAPITPV